MTDIQYTDSGSYTEERPGRETASEGKRENEPAHDCVCSSITDNLPSDDTGTGMALSVTRHASTPPVTQFQIILLGYTGRESLKSDNSLPHSLPEKDKEYQHHLRVVESGRQSAHGYPLLSLLVYRRKVAKMKAVNLSGYHMTIRYPAKVKILIHTPVGVGRLTDPPTNAYYEKIKIPLLV